MSRLYIANKTFRIDAKKGCGPELYKKLLQSPLVEGLGIHRLFYRVEALPEEGRVILRPGAAVEAGIAVLHVTPRTSVKAHDNLQLGFLGPVPAPLAQFHTVPRGMQGKVRYVADVTMQEDSSLVIQLPALMWQAVELDPLPELG